MAKVSHISKAMVKALAGEIDFYYWKGIPVARKWPDWSKFKPSENQKLSMAAMVQSRLDLKNVTPRCRDYWRAAHVGKSGAWLDIYTTRWLNSWKVAHVDPNVVMDIIYTPPASDAHVCFLTKSGGPVKVCVFKGGGTFKPDMKDSKGMSWKCWVPATPTCVWCGMAFPELDLHLGPISVGFLDIQFRASGWNWQVDPLDSCLGAWDLVWLALWGGPDVQAFGAVVKRRKSGAVFGTQVYESRTWIEVPIQQWWAAFPGVQPMKIVYHAEVVASGDFAGNMLLPEFFVSVELDQAAVDVPFDVSGVSFPPADWKFQITPDRMYQPYCPPWPPDTNFLGSYLRSVNPGKVDIYSSSSDWACITIPESVFSGPGTFWAAACDDSGIPIPGPFLMLK